MYSVSVYGRVSAAGPAGTLSFCAPATQVQCRAASVAAADAAETSDARCWSTCGQSAPANGRIGPVCHS